MRQFMMNGKAITSPMRFRECFDPRDLLRSRELAAGFLMHQFRYLSPPALYHTEMFFQTIFCGKDSSGGGTAPSSAPTEFCAEDYCRAFGPRISLEKPSVMQFVDKQLARENAKKLRQALFALSRETKLMPEEQKKLFFLLTAAYSLAAKSLEDCPLTAEEAESAYLRLAPAEKIREPWLTFDSSGKDILLEASEEPWKILMVQNARELLAQGHTISHRKFIALPHAQGDTDIPLTLELYRAPDDPHPQTVRIAVGDYRYFNFVKHIPVHYHPRGIRFGHSEKDILLREGKTLIYRGKSIPIANGLDIYGFAPEESGCGFILLTSDGVKYNNYSRRNEQFYLPSQNIVQVAFRGTECLLLDHAGHIQTLHSDHSYPSPVVRLEDVLQKQK